MKVSELSVKQLTIALAKKLRENLKLNMPITDYESAVNLVLEYLDELEE